jgi:hypothetical protein
LGLIVAAVLLSNWKLRFAVDAPDLYAELYDEAAAEAENDTLGWLVSAAYGHHNLRRANANRVRIMGALLTLLGVLMVLKPSFGLWRCGRIGFDGTSPRPTRPDQSPVYQDWDTGRPGRLDSSGTPPERQVAPRRSDAGLTSPSSSA